MRRFAPSYFLAFLTILLTLAPAVFALAADRTEEERAQREKAWSLTTQLELARERGEIVSPDAYKTLPTVPVINSPMDNPDVKINTEANRTQSENSIAVSPLDNKVLLNSNNSTDFPVTTVLGASWFLSTNGGLTWSGSSAGPTPNRGDPAALIDLSGKFYIGYIHSSGGMGVSYSTNQGSSWSHVAVTTAASQDKNHLMVDNVASSPFAGRVYNSWVDLGGGANANDIVFSYSSNGGANWSAITNISNAIAAGSHNQGVNIQTGPAGEVYCAWAVYDAFPADETAIGFNKSTTGGASWLGESRIITGIRGHRNTTLPNTSIRRNSFPSMAVDVSGGPRNGHIYIVWTNIGVPGVNSGSADIYMARSTNGGTSWGTPIKVNSDAGSASQWFPWISCDPVTGELSVVFYDRRDDPGNSLTAAYVAHSLDGGATWDNFRVGDVQFTPVPIPGLAGGYMGDYLAIASRGGRAYPCWGDQRTSPFTTYVSPIAYSDPSDPNPPTGVAAYSDYATPTSVALSWTDPTTYADGSPLGNFSINIYRDAAFIQNVDQGIGAYVDGGRTDGVEYDYELRAKDDVTDSLSLPATVSATAGGSQTPAPPTAFTAIGSATDASLQWTNPVDQDDGTPLDDFAGIKIYRNNVLIQTLNRATTDTGAVDVYLDTPPLGFVYTYEVSAFDNEIPVHESVRATQQTYVGSVPNILVWQPAPLATTSGTEIFNVLSGLGESVFYSQNLHEFGAISQHEIVFVVNGIYSNNHVLTPAEGAELDAYVSGGGKLYLESGDGFNYDPESAGGYNIRPIFGLADGNDGGADLFNLTGLNDLSGFASAYTGGNNFIDELVAVTSSPIWKNTSNTDIVGVFHLYGGGRSIGCSHEFGGLDGAALAPNGPWISYEPNGPFEDVIRDVYKPASAGVDLDSEPAHVPLRMVANTDENRIDPADLIQPQPGIQTTTPADIMAAYLDLLRQSTTPNIVVGASSLADTLVETLGGSVTFTVKNQGALVSPLLFSISENPAVAWASESPLADTLGANEEVTITVNLSSAVGVGLHTTNLEIASNDSANPLVILPLSMLVVPRPIMEVSRNNFDFTILQGDSVQDGYTLYNNGGGPLTYDVDVTYVSGPGGLREAFNDVTNSFFGNSRSRGNVYSVSSSTSLTKIETYLGLTGATDLEFFVYEANTPTGTFNKIFSSGTVVMGPGTQFFVSPGMGVPLAAGKFYYIGTAWNQSATYFNNNGVVVPPVPVSFGSLQYGVTAGSGFPAPASTSLSSSTIINTQAITTGFGVQAVMLTALSGNLGSNTSVAQQFKAVSDPLAALGTYHFDLTTNGDDPQAPQKVIDLSVRVVGSLTGVDAAGGLVPTAFALRQNEPNPFNPMTKVLFELPRETRASLVVYDASGRRVATLVDAVLPAGRHERPWLGRDDSGRDVASGVYILRMDAGSFSDQMKMTLLK